VTSTANIRYVQPTGREALSGSANWAFDNGVHVSRDSGTGRMTRALSQCAFAVLFTVSSMTSGPDPWSENRQQRSRHTMSALMQSSRRRRITLREALRLADEIMRRAEEGRTKAAIEEANRQSDLGDWA
jgi:hypothetical protein